MRRGQHDVVSIRIRKWIIRLACTCQPRSGLDSARGISYRAGALILNLVYHMLRILLTFFLSGLLLITWADDIYLGSQAPGDTFNDFSENDTYLPSEAPDITLSKTLTNRASLDDVVLDLENSPTKPSLNHIRLAPAPWPQPGRSLVYLIMLLLQ